MQFPIIKRTNKLERIFLLTVLVILGLIIGSVAGALFSPLTGCDPMSLDSLRFMQISSQIFTFIIPPILYAALTKEKPFKSLGFNKSTLLWLILGATLIYFIMPLNSVFAEWNANIKLPESMSALENIMKELQENATEIMEKMVNVNTVGGLVLNLFMIAGLAALGEEMLFRSVIQTSLIKICKNAHVGIFLASFIFSFIHFEFYGFIPRLVLGLLLGYMFYYSNSIWIPMAMHFMNNGTIVVLYFLNNVGITNIDVESFGETNTFILILSIVATAALIYIAIKYSHKYNKDKASVNN